MRYIRRLSNEIHILEGGDLDYEITVRGNDELAALAQGLDDMRRAFRKQMESESYLMRSNQKLLAQMSHDLRTPLTTILLYTGILKEHAYETEEELMLYLEKLEMKAQQLKHLSENMVSYALVSSESRTTLEPPESFRVLFSDPLSELAGYLEQNDFFVIPPESLPTQMVCVNSDYIMRIMDNISSNILKYAAPGYPVQIKAMETDHQICLSFQNRKNASSQDTEGYRIGLESIRNMMAQMHGSSEVVQDGTSFELRLFFPRLSSQ
jgi:signal transduction histidine kinase